MSILVRNPESSRGFSKTGCGFPSSGHVPPHRTRFIFLAKGGSFLRLIGVGFLQDEPVPRSPRVKPTRHPLERFHIQDRGKLCALLEELVRDSFQADWTRAWSKTEELREAWFRKTPQMQRHLFHPMTRNRLWRLRRAKVPAVDRSVFVWLSLLRLAALRITNEAAPWPDHSDPWIVRLRKAILGDETNSEAAPGPIPRRRIRWIEPGQEACERVALLRLLHDRCLPSNQADSRPTLGPLVVGQVSTRQLGGTAVDWHAVGREEIRRKRGTDPKEGGHSSPATTASKPRGRQ